jgi:hypothetical protein
METRELMAFAFVSQEIFEQSDILTALLPFFKPLIAEQSGALFDKEKLAAQVRAVYGWNLTTDTIDLLSTRLSKKGWIQRTHEKSNELAYICRLDASSLEQDSPNEQVSETLNTIGNLFLNYLGKEVGTLFSFSYDSYALREMILYWLVQKRAFDRESLLKASELNEDISVLFNRAKSRRTVGKDKYSREEDYLCARFVQHLFKEHSFYFEKLVRIAAVALVVEVALAIRNPPSNKNSSSLDVFFDAPFVMNFLGLSGRGKQGLAEYIVKALSDLKIRLFIFRHSCDEIRQILQAMLSQTQDRRYGPTALAMKLNLVDSGFVSRVATNTDLIVEKAGFKIVDYNPNLEAKEHQFFNGDDIDDFAHLLPWDDSQREDADQYYSLDKEQAKRRDSLSIAYIMRKRGGGQSTDFFRSRYAFVSHNATLCRLAKKYCVEHCSLSPGSVSPAVHQSEISAILWLALGNAEKVEISRQSLLDQCEAIVAASPEAIEGTKKRLKAIKPEHAAQIDFLLGEPRSIQLALDLTLGSGFVATPRDGERILAELRRSVVTEEREAANIVIQRQEEKFQSELSKQTQEYERLAEENRIYRENIERMENEERQMLEWWIIEADKKIASTRRWESRLVYFLLALTPILTGWGTWAELDIHWLAVTLFVAAGISAVVACIQYNRNGRILTDSFYRRAKSRIFHRLLKINGRNDLLKKYNFDSDGNLITIKSLPKTQNSLSRTDQLPL